MLGVCLLGSVTAWTGDAPLPMTRPLERALLARLALASGQVVDAPRLLDELWMEPTNGGMAALHTLVYRLRRTLETEGAAVVKKGEGYALRIDPARVDLCRFEQLAALGRESCANGEPAEGAATLGAALGLWRGPALADVGDVPYALAKRTTLEEQQLAVLELWVQANLDCGRHSEVIGRLEAVLTDQPMREGLWAKLILALYRCGRQGDALGGFQRLRLLLAEELGVDPSPPLMALQQQVLQQSSELDLGCIVISVRRTNRGHNQAWENGPAGRAATSSRCDRSRGSAGLRR